MKRKKRTPKVIAAFLGVVAIVTAGWWIWQSRPGSDYEVELGFAILEDAFYDRRDGFMAEVSGTVTRVLAANPNDPTYQRFIIRLENGQSILIVHNQAAGNTVPVAIDDRVTVRGEFEWSETGGLLKNTHMDLSPKRRHGFVEHDGKRYQ